MLIWPTAHRVGESEHEVAEALRNVPDGIALVSVRLPGTNGREIDVLVIQPHGVTTIEAKGTRLHGAVTASDNGDWLIGDQVADFAGHATNPIAQAAVQAQRLNALCHRHHLDVGFVPALIAVAGDVTCDVAPMSGGVWVTDLAHLPAALTTPRRGRPLTRPVVRELLGLLGLGTRLPDDTALDAARFPRDDGSMPPATTVTPPAPVAAPPPPAHTPAPRYAPPPQYVPPPAYAYAPPPPYAAPPPYAPPPPPYYHDPYAYPPPAYRGGRRQQRGRGRPATYDQWPHYRRRRPSALSRLARGIGKLMLLGVAALVALSLLSALVSAEAQKLDQQAPSPTPTHRPVRHPAHRPTHRPTPSR